MLKKHCHMYLKYKDLKKLVRLISSSSSSLAYGNSEAEFVYVLNNEIDKFNLFFMEQEEDFIIRHKELQQRTKRVKKESAEEMMSSIGKDMVDFHGEMVLLINYSNINYTGIAKILKKYDKQTGGLLRLPFIQKVLEQPFFTTDQISKLVKECEAIIDELFPMGVVDEEMKEAAITMAGEEGIFRNIVAALMTMKEIRKGSSTQSHFSLPILNLPDTELTRSFQIISPISII